MTEHLPDRPSWNCQVCGRPWPCDPAREGLVEELDHTQLTIYMVVQLGVAAADIPTADPGELYERFVMWTRGGPSGCPRA